MLIELLAKSVPEGGKIIGKGEAALDALLGFIVVFLGIAFLVAIVWLVGLIMRKAGGKGKAVRPEKEKEEISVERSETVTKNITESEEISEETVAVITAAIMAYYSKEQPKCEFTVKRIKKI